MGNILPSSLLPLKEWIRNLSSAPPALWLVAHVTGVLTCPTASAVGAGSWRRGSMELSHLRLQYGFRVMCGLGESQGKPDHFMEEKHILPAHPHPPSSPKATSKTDHRDGTEEHALKRGRGEDVSSCGEADPASLPCQASHHQVYPSQLVWVQSLLPSQPMQGPCPH